MKKSFIAVVAGGPLLALGVGAPTAWAAPPPDAGPPTQDHPNVSVSVNGTPKVQKGSGSFADSGSVGDHNVAVAVNDSSALVFGGTRGRATAVNGSLAQVSAASVNNNHSTAINGGQAFTNQGSNNHATAVNDGSVAVAFFGDNNHAVATCGGSATAFGGGSHDTRNGGNCGG